MYVVVGVLYFLLPLLLVTVGVSYIVGEGTEGSVIAARSWYTPESNRGTCIHSTLISTQTFKCAAHRNLTIRTIFMYNVIFNVNLILNTRRSKLRVFLVDLAVDGSWQSETSDGSLLPLEVDPLSDVSSV